MERKLILETPSQWVDGRAGRRRGKHAFSLIELLVVISIMAIVTTLTIPAVTSIQTSMQMTQAGSSVGDLLSLARQTALGYDCSVAVRFYQSATAGGPFIGCQAVMLQDNGTQQPVQRPIWLPQAIVLSTNSSHTQPLLLSTTTGTTTLSGQQPMNYVQFCYLRDGSTDLDPSQPWYFTLTSRQGMAQTVPSNFVTFLIEPGNGTVKCCRP